MSFSTRKVIVVGAGAAGIAAATKLYEHGIKDIIVLEAQNRIGGRIHSVDLGDRGCIDFGAQWVHGEIGNVAFELGRAHNLLHHGDDFCGTQFVSCLGDVIEKPIADKANSILHQLRYTNYSTKVNFEKPVSIGTVFTEQWKKELENDVLIPTNLRTSFFEWFHMYSNHLDGCNTWFELSLSQLVEYIECKGNPAITWKTGGYENILTLLMEKVNIATSGNFKKNYIKLNHRVTSINPNTTGGVTVACENGAIFKADHVIVTVSLAVLKNTYKDLFKFQLPQYKIEAIQGIGINTVNKIFVFFPHRWWPNSINGFNLLWIPEEKKIYQKKGLGWLTDIFGFYKADNAPTALVGWIVGQSANEMETIPEDKLTSLINDLLRKFLGDQYEIPEITLLKRSCWNSNPNIGGSYSHRTLLTDKLHTDSSKLSIPIIDDKGIPVILFAGEATHPCYFSTVHGAIESGWKQADNIRKIYEEAR